MKKKDLLLQNTQLFDRLTAAEEQIAALKAQLAESEKKICILKSENERLTAKANATEPFRQLESKVIKQAEVPRGLSYGASVIGKTVVDAAKYCNVLTADGRDDSAKELVNLILGRTEVLKSEILSITSSADSDETKTQRIDAARDAALDYFKSVMAQRQQS